MQMGDIMRTNEYHKIIASVLAMTLKYMYPYPFFIQPPGLFQSPVGHAYHPPFLLSLTRLSWKPVQPG